MKTIFKTLLTSSFLILTATHTNAEQAVGFDSQGPVWDAGQVPIVWGDCVPVPIAPQMMPPMNMPMGDMGNPMLMQPMPMPPAYPMQGSMPLEPAFAMPPPSPFFNSQIPAPLPMPMPAIPPQIVEAPVCSDPGVDLGTLQNQYDQAIAASRAKIEDMSLAMEDAQNQISDARLIIEKLSKEQESDRAKMAELAKQKNNLEAKQEDANRNLQKVLSTADELTKLKEENSAISKEKEAAQKKLSEMDGAFKTLQSELATIKRDAGAQARKLTVLGQSATELKALQSAYKDRNNENAALKLKLAEYDTANKTLLSRMETLKSEAGAQARKLTALGQSTTQLAGLQSAYKSQNDENALLKKKLSELDAANKTLHSQMETLKAEAGSQARKLTALGQSTTQLAGLQSAYKSQNDENALLKKKLTELDAANKTLHSQMETLKAEAGAQARKLTALGQSSTELAGLKSAYKSRNDENVLLKNKLADLDKKLNSLNTMSTLKAAQDIDIINNLKTKLANFDNENKTLKTQLATAEANSGAQARKLTALGQSTTQLAGLQSAYKARNDENNALKKKLAEVEKKLSSLNTMNTLKGAQDLETIKSLKEKLATFDNENKTLKTKLATAEASSGAQARKLTALGQSAVELTALQSAYKERNTENGILKGQLAQLEAAEAACKAASAELEKKLVDSESERKTLLAKIGTLETQSADQARKITALMTASGELDALKSAYKDLSAKKVELASKLTAATADADNDGVLDSVDECPFSLEGAEVNAIGCLADADNDGVIDSKDKCPASPAGSKVNDTGCPRIKDTDKDGIADANDLCPNTVAGTTVNKLGCAPTEAITLKGVNFELGSAKLTQASYPILDAAAETLKKTSNLNIEIAGHTDFQGPAALNKNLSQRRANTVMIYLIKKGVKTDGLTAKGYGEEKPIASNDTKEGRATNRRVELLIK